MEFAAERYGTRLVVVMDTPTAAPSTPPWRRWKLGAPPASDNVMSIVERVRPAVETAKLAGGYCEAVARAATRINVRMAVQHLRHGPRPSSGW